MTIVLITQLIALLAAVFLAVYFFSANIQLRKYAVESRRREKRLTIELKKWQNVFLRKVGAGTLNPAPFAASDTQPPPARVVSASQAIALEQRSRRPQIAGLKVPDAIREKIIKSAGNIRAE